MWRRCSRALTGLCETMVHFSWQGRGYLSLSNWFAAMEVGLFVKPHSAPHILSVVWHRQKNLCWKKGGGYIRLYWKVLWIQCLFDSFYDLVLFICNFWSVLDLMASKCSYFQCHWGVKFSAAPRLCLLVSSLGGSTFIFSANQKLQLSDHEELDN